MDYTGEVKFNDAVVVSISRAFYLRRFTYYIWYALREIPKMADLDLTSPV